MIRVIAFGSAAGVGIQALRQWPSDGPVTQSSIGLLLPVAVLLAYLGGRWHSRGGAVAVASASATASATAHQAVNVAVFTPGAGGGLVGRPATAVRYPSEGAPWMTGPPGSAAELLDGGEYADLVQDVEDEEEEAAVIGSLRGTG